MARTQIDVPLVWTLISARECVILIDKRPERRNSAGRILFNTVPDDLAAIALTFNSLGRQVLVEFRANTYCRAEAEGWGIVVDD